MIVIKARNHFEEFVTFLKEQTWMSESFRKELIVIFMSAQADAYERGVNSEKTKIMEDALHVAPQAIQQHE